MKSPRIGVYFSSILNDKIRTQKYSKSKSGSSVKSHDDILRKMSARGSKNQIMDIACDRERLQAAPRAIINIPGTKE